MLSFLATIISFWALWFYLPGGIITLDDLSQRTRWWRQNICSLCPGSFITQIRTHFSLWRGEVWSTPCSLKGGFPNCLVMNLCVHLQEALLPGCAREVDSGGRRAARLARITRTSAHDGAPTSAWAFPLLQKCRVKGAEANLPLCQARQGIREHFIKAQSEAGILCQGDI